MPAPESPTSAALRLETSPYKLNVGERVAAGFLACVCLALLIVAARLDPEPAGVGTHMQLGLPPCGWVAKYNRPCVMCGMTTAFAEAAHARPVASFLTQPAGALGALGVAAGFWGGLVAAFSGARVDRLLANMLRPRSVLVLGMVVLAAWIYKLLTWSGTA
jgi:hypothetical protein